MANSRNENSKENLSSLQLAWGKNSQQKWKRLREESITRAVTLISEENDFDEIYKFLVAERTSIAIRMNSEHEFISHVAKFRVNDIDPGVPSPLSSTPVTSYDNSPYRDFYTYLYNIFNQYESYHLALDKDLFYPWEYHDLMMRTRSNSSYFDYLGENDDGSISITAEFTNSNLRIKYSSIIAINSASMPDAEPYLLILHTPAENIPYGLERIKELFCALKQTKPESLLLKINLIKEITWHLSHIMTQNRGSAAINEMLLEANLRCHGIAYKNTSKIPVDLIAIFSMKFEDFLQRFIINPEIENLEKNIQHFITHCKNQLKTPSIYFGYQQMIWTQSYSTDTNTKINAAEKVVKLLNGHSCEAFTTSEENALNKGDLADMLNSADPNLHELLLKSNTVTSDSDIPVFFNSTK